MAVTTRRPHAVVSDAVRTYLNGRDGVTAAAIADAIGEKADTVATVLRRLARRGDVVRVDLGTPGRSLVRWFRADGARLESPTTDRSGLRAAIVDQLGGDELTIRELTHRTGATREAVKAALYRLAEQGTVKRVATVGRSNLAVWSLAAGPIEADDWTPAPFINPIRARALGLPVGGRS